jgi:hypothetical protein
MNRELFLKEDTIVYTEFEFLTGFPLAPASICWPG